MAFNVQMKGIVKQGVRCKDCNVNCHKHCKDYIVVDCSKRKKSKQWWALDGVEEEDKQWWALDGVEEEDKQWWALDGVEEEDKQWWALDGVEDEG